MAQPLIDPVLAERIEKASSSIGSFQLPMLNQLKDINQQLNQDCNQVLLTFPSRLKSLMQQYRFCPVEIQLSYEMGTFGLLWPRSELTVAQPKLREQLTLVPAAVWSQLMRPLATSQPGCLVLQQRSLLWLPSSS